METNETLEDARVIARKHIGNMIDDFVEAGLDLGYYPDNATSHMTNAIMHLLEYQLATNQAIEINS